MPIPSNYIRYGREPGYKPSYKITWKRVENRIPETMEDDSLIHLFTKKKRIKRRTELLNAHIRAQPSQAISYPDYIKSKTAILRSYSEDEETTDDSDCELRTIKTVKDSRRSALHILIQEMMLESPGSSDEAEIQTPKKYQKPVQPLAAATTVETSKNESVEKTGRRKSLRKSSEKPKPTISVQSTPVETVETSKNESVEKTGRRKSLRKSSEKPKPTISVQSTPVEPKRTRSRSKKSLTLPESSEKSTPKAKTEKKSVKKRPERGKAAISAQPTPVEPKKPRGRPRKSLALPQTSETLTSNPKCDEKTIKTRSKRQCTLRKYSSEGSRSRVRARESSSEEEDRVNSKIVTVMIESQPQCADSNENLQESTVIRSEDDPLAPDVQIKEPVTPKKDYSTDNEISGGDRVFENSFSEIDEKIDTNDGEVVHPKTPKKDYLFDNDGQQHHELSELHSDLIDEKIGSEEQFAEQNSKEITDEFQNWLEDSSGDEFYTPNTTDNDSHDDDDNFEDSREVQNEEYLGNENNQKEQSELNTQNAINDDDDLFEEEKVITQSDYRIGGLSQYRSDLINKHRETHQDSDDDLKDEVENFIPKSISEETCAKRDKKNKKDQSAEPCEHLRKSSENEESLQVGTDDRRKTKLSKKSRKKADSTENDITRAISLTQEFDDKNEAMSENVEEHINNAITKVDGGKERKKSKERSEQPSSFLEQIKSHEKNPEDGSKISPTSKGQEKSTNKDDKEEAAVNKVTPSGEKRKSNQSSPKTPADVRKNLLATLDSIVPEKSVQPTLDPPLSSTDGENSQPGDLPSPPRDSGIDEDSETMPPQDYKIFKSPKKPKEDDQLNSEKKKINVKITCTEVVTSKYTIIRNNKDKNAKSTPTKAGNLNISRQNRAFNRPANSERSDSEDTEDDGARSGMLTFRNQLRNYDSDDSNSDSNRHNQDGRQKRKRKRDSLSFAPTESESLKYVLNRLNVRDRYEDPWKGAEAEVLQQNLTTASTAEDSESDSVSDEPFTRPTTIPEFVDGKDFQLLEGLPVFSLTDITEDDDFYLLEVPKSVIEKDLKGQKFKLKKKKMILGEDRYNIQTKEGEPMSCVLHSGDDKNRYKTGIINPLKQIFVKQQVKDDFVKTPKLESDVGCVPFPKNVRARNPLVMDREDLSLSMSRIEDDNSEDEEESIVLPSQSRFFDGEGSGEEENMEVEGHVGDPQDLRENEEKCDDLELPTAAESSGKKSEEHSNLNIAEHEDWQTPKKHKKCKTHKSRDRKSPSISPDREQVTDGIKKDELSVDEDPGTSKKSKKSKEHHSAAKNTENCDNEEEKEAKDPLVDKDVKHFDDKGDKADDLIPGKSAEEESEDHSNFKIEEHEDLQTPKKHKKSKKHKLRDRKSLSISPDRENVTDGIKKDELQVDEDPGTSKKRKKSKKHRSADKNTENSDNERKTEMPYFNDVECNKQEKEDKDRLLDEDVKSIDDKQDKADDLILGKSAEEESEDHSNLNIEKHGDLQTPKKQKKSKKHKLRDRKSSSISPDRDNVKDGIKKNELSIGEDSGTSKKKKKSKKHRFADKNEENTDDERKMKMPCFNDKECNKEEKNENGLVDEDINNFDDKEDKSDDFIPEKSEDHSNLDIKEHEDLQTSRKHKKSKKLKLHDRKSSSLSPDRDNVKDGIKKDELSVDDDPGTSKKKKKSKKRRSADKNAENTDDEKKMKMLYFDDVECNKEEKEGKDRLVDKDVNNFDDKEDKVDDFIPGKSAEEESEDHSSLNIEEHEDLQTPKKHKKSIKHKLRDRKSSSLSPDRDNAKDGIEKDDLSVDEHPGTSKKTKKLRKQRSADKNAENTDDEKEMKMPYFNDVECNKEKKDDKNRLVDEDVKNFDDKDQSDDLIPEKSAEEEAADHSNLNIEEHKDLQTPEKHKKSKNHQLSREKLLSCSPDRDNSNHEIKKDEHQSDVDLDALKKNEKSLDEDDSDLKVKNDENYTLDCHDEDPGTSEMSQNLRTSEKTLVNDPSFSLEDNPNLEMKEDELQCDEDLETLQNHTESKENCSIDKNIESSHDEKKLRDVSLFKGSSSDEENDEGSVDIEDKKYLESQKNNSDQDLETSRKFQSPGTSKKKLRKLKRVASSRRISYSSSDEGCPSINFKIDERSHDDSSNDIEPSSNFLEQENRQILDENSHMNVEKLESLMWLSKHSSSSDEDYSEVKKGNEKTSDSEKEVVESSRSLITYADNDANSDSEENKLEKYTSVNNRSSSSQDENTSDAKIKKDKQNHVESAEEDSVFLKKLEESEKSPIKDDHIKNTDKKELKLENFTLFNKDISSEDEDSLVHENESSKGTKKKKKVKKSKDYSLLENQLENSEVLSQETSLDEDNDVKSKIDEENHRESADEERETSENFQEPRKNHMLDENSESSIKQERKLTGYTLFSTRSSSEEEDNVDYSDKIIGSSTKLEKSKQHKLFSEPDSMMSLYEDFKIDIKDEIIPQISESKLIEDQTDTKIRKNKKSRKRPIEDVALSESELDLGDKTSFHPADEDFDIPKKRRKSKKKKKKSSIKEAAVDLDKPDIELDFKGKKRKRKDSEISSAISSSDDEVTCEMKHQMKVEKKEEEREKEELKLKRKSFYEQLMDDDED